MNPGNSYFNLDYSIDSKYPDLLQPRLVNGNFLADNLTLLMLLAHQACFAILSVDYS